MGFHDIIGHKRQIEVITRALGSGKLPHAYLFTGLRGIGKRLVAVELIRALQCSSGGEKPCGKCSGCKKTAEGAHPDIITIEPEGNYIKIEQVRELQKRLGFKPFEGKVTGCIIDGADRLNVNAANALLKTLEEPPSNTHIILLAENIRQIIPTVVSRCQRIRFFPLASTEVETVLTKKAGLPEDEARLAARVSEGSPGRALAFLENFPAEIRSDLMSSITGLDSIDDVFSLSEELTNRENAARLLETIEVIKLFIRDMVLLRAGTEGESTINFDNLAIIEREAGRYSMKGLIGITETISEVERAITLNANKRIAVEKMLLDIYYSREDLCREL